jgi:hypothetical protein
MPTDLCRFCGSSYDIIRGHTCRPTIATSQMSAVGAPGASGIPSAPTGGDPRTWTFTIHGRAWSANHDHEIGRWGVTEQRAQWKKSAFYLAKHTKIPPLRSARLNLKIHLRNGRRADPQNYPSGSSLKGLIDGLVAAGVVPDDRPPYLDVRMPTMAPLDGGAPRVEVTITEVRR